MAKKLGGGGRPGAQVSRTRRGEEGWGEKEKLGKGQGPRPPLGESSRGNSREMQSARGIERNKTGRERRPGAQPSQERGNKGRSAT